jgi:hypothetical protein
MVKIKKIFKKLKKRTSSFAMFKNGKFYQEAGGKKKFFNRFNCIF